MWCGIRVIFQKNLRKNESFFIQTFSTKYFYFFVFDNNIKDKFENVNLYSLVFKWCEIELYFEKF